MDRPLAHKIMTRERGAVCDEDLSLDLPGASLSWAVNCSSSEKRITIFVRRAMPSCG